MVLKMASPSVASDISPSAMKPVEAMHAKAPLLSPGSKLASAGVYYSTGRPQSAKSIKATSHTMISGLTKASPTNVGPQDGTWVRRAEQDETYEEERIHMGDDLRKHHLQRADESGQQIQELKKREKSTFDTRQKAIKAEARKERARLKAIRMEELEKSHNLAVQCHEEAMQTERDNIEETHKTMAAVFDRVYSEDSEENQRTRHQLMLEGLWAQARDDERKHNDEVDDRKKHESEAASMEMRAIKKALDDKADKVRNDFCRRAKTEMVQETKTEHQRDDAKAKDRFNKSVEGRKANLHYDATHGDRLQWSAPPTVGQMDKDGDGVLTGDEVKKNRKEGGFSIKPGAD